MLSTLLTVLLILDALVLMVLIIGLQHGNEGGLGSALGSGNSAGFFGASGGVNFIVRATWIAGIAFFLLTLSLSWVKTNEKYGVKSELTRDLLSTPPATDAPAVGSPEAAVSPATDASSTAAPASPQAPEAKPDVSGSPAPAPAAPASP
jgi:preprotein translocase subunit SecG